jgi:hypothetical protein
MPDREGVPFVQLAGVVEVAVACLQREPRKRWGRGRGVGERGKCCSVVVVVVVAVLGMVVVCLQREPRKRWGRGRGAVKTKECCHCAVDWRLMLLSPWPSGQCRGNPAGQCAVRVPRFIKT